LDRNLIIPEISSENFIWQILLKDADLTREIQHLLDVGEYIWQNGWAEANAGNVSIRLPAKLNAQICELHNNLLSRERADTGISESDAIWLLVSASGSRFRDYRKIGLQNFVLVGFNHKATNLDSLLNPLIIPSERKPSSELISHITVQNQLRLHRNTDKVILHAHPTDWIIVSNLSIYRESPQNLIKVVYNLLPEMKLYFPDTFELLPYAEPGSAELSTLTADAIINSCVVIWEKHGLLITAENINQAYDYLEIMAKAAKIYLASLSYIKRFN
jgi:rhamnulose-1-phosphate aldolase